MIVEFRYRTAPERMQQGGYAYRGRAEVVFSSYALTPEELKIIREELDKDDMDDLIELIEGATTESLEQIHVDLDEFLEEKEKNGNFIIFIYFTCRAAKITRGEATRCASFEGIVGV